MMAYCYAMVDKVSDSGSWEPLVFILTSFSVFGNDPEILRVRSDLESEVSFTNRKWRTRDVLKLFPLIFFDFDD